ncbi:MAG TPA: hypothetical protein VFO44_06615 [Steroidobacteraceae bacterium]|nr:hypothetical protein [Steroidobacteraceae bacterium]
MPSTAKPKSNLRKAARLGAAVLRLAGRAAELVPIGLALIVLAGTAGVRAAEPWPEMPAPPKAKVQWIAQDMRVNGVPTRVWQFESRASRQEVIAYYTAYWAGDGAGGYEHKPSVHALGDATVIGQVHGPYLMNVKVEDGPKASSKGLISVAQVLGSKPDHAPGLVPLMPGGHVVSVVESRDPGKQSRQVLVLTPQPVASVIQFYRASFLNAGWKQVQGDEQPRRIGRTSTGFAVFAREDSEMQLSMVDSPQGRGTTLLANLVTKDTGP